MHARHQRNRSPYLLILMAFDLFFFLILNEMVLLVVVFISHVLRNNVAVDLTWIHC